MLTLVLAVITAYYALITHKMLINDNQKRLRCIRPVIIANIKKLSFVDAPDIDPSDPLYNTQASFEFEIYNFKSDALNISAQFEFPWTYDEEIKKYDYILCLFHTPHPVILEHKQCWSGTEKCTTYDIKWFSPPLNKIYLVLQLTYKDIDQNKYSHRIYFEISHYKYVGPKVAKAYEEVYMLEFEKLQTWSGDSFDSEKMTEVFSQRK